MLFKTLHFVRSWCIAKKIFKSWSMILHFKLFELFEVTWFSISSCLRSWNGDLEGLEASSLKHPLNFKVIYVTLSHDSPVQPSLDFWSHFFYLFFFFFVWILFLNYAVFWPIMIAGYSIQYLCFMISLQADEHFTSHSTL